MNLFSLPVGALNLQSLFGAPTPGLPGALGMSSGTSPPNLGTGMVKPVTVAAPPAPGIGSPQPNFGAPPAQPTKIGSFQNASLAPPDAGASAASGLAQHLFAPEQPGGFGAPPPQKGFGGFLNRFLHPTNSLGELGQALVMAGGTPLGDAYKIMSQNEEHRRAAAAEAARFEREGSWHDQERQNQVADREYEQAKPQFFSGNEDRIKFDPVSGATSKVYDAPTDAQDYASTLGFAPESKEYHSALQDYVLRSSGPTAANYRSGLEDQRFDNRVSLKGTPTYRDSHRPPPGAPPSRGPGPSRTMAGVIAPILAKVAAGQPLSAGEQQAFEMYHRGGGRGGKGGGKQSPGAAAEGSIAMGPGGHKLILRGGRWVALN